MSTFMLGSMIFTPILSQLADRYGRRITYLLPLWITVIANVGCAMAPTYTIFLICRFIAGVGTAGIGTIGFVIILETVAPAFRSHTPLVSTIIWVSGYCTVGLVHMAFQSWRVQYFILSAPFLLTFSFYWLLPESLHWLVTHEKHDGVSKYIKRSTKYNRRQIDLEICRSSTSPSLVTEGEGEGEEILESSSIKKSSTKDASHRNFLDILTHLPMLFQLSSHCFIMIVMNFTYWALSLYSTDLHENKMVGYFLSGLVELPAAAAIFALAYIGRRSVTSMALLAQAFAMFIACFFPGKFNLIGIISIME
uniref:Major facilitator superfamily (MFS) profile domain-containing protein n=1 Tax=Panagrolaimus superbus TaxID=310955 RepID=A0A914YFJ8_9BILA